MENSIKLGGLRVFSNDKKSGSLISGPVNEARTPREKYSHKNRVFPGEEIVVGKN